MARLAILLLITFFLLLQCTSANLDKLVFLGPPPVGVAREHPNLDDLNLPQLSSSQPSLRTRVSAAFPTVEAKNGLDTWFLLDGLTEGQRYEVRISWPATVGDPTSTMVLINSDSS